MDNPEDLKFEVGQEAETKTFEEGFRGAWFRCKIKDIDLTKNKILPEYFDYEEEEEEQEEKKIKWMKIYELPHYGRKSKQIKRQLMVRPPYPQMYHINEMPPVDSISKVRVIIDEWKVGDLVDWYKDDCYWSARVIKILTDREVQIQLPMPPAGEGEDYKALCKDLRPSLDWSPIEGWTLPTMKGQASCSAQLIFPSQQDMDVEMEEVASPVNASSTSRISAISSAAPIEEEPLQSEETKLVGNDVEKESSSDSISTMRVEEEPLQSEEMKFVCNDVENASSSDSISTMRVEEYKTDDAAWKNVDGSIMDLNIMHEETIEASIFDLEELANRIKWLKSILDNGQPESGIWEFAGQS